MYDALTINKQQQHLSSFLLLLLFYFNIINNTYCCCVQLYYYYCMLQTVWSITVYPLRELDLPYFTSAKTHFKSDFHCSSLSRDHEKTINRVLGRTKPNLAEKKFIQFIFDPVCTESSRPERQQKRK